MIGMVPYTSTEMSAYLNGGMDYLGSSSLYNGNLAIPKIQSLAVDAFQTTAKHVDKKNTNWKTFGLWIASVAAATFCARKCFSKSCELVSDVVNATSKGAVNVCKETWCGICSPFRWIGNKFKK